MPTGRPLASSLTISSATAFVNAYVFGHLPITLETSYKCELITLPNSIHVLNMILFQDYCLSDYVNFTYLILNGHKLMA
jgi:hypothetical protein